MKLCFAVKEAADLESEVYGHFGSAPVFVIFDSATEALSVVHNADRQHAHGMCNPVAALGGRDVDAVIVGGIGRGALMKLNGAGIRVFRATAGTVRDNIRLAAAQQLPEFKPEHVCGGHGGGCSH